MKFQRDGVTACGLFLATGLVLEKMKAEQQVDVTLAVRAVRKSRPTFITNLVHISMFH
jgi:Protein-tyrosine phosphatase